MQEFKVNGHAPSILPDGEWELVFADEFDGDTIDESKWDYRVSMMGKEHPAWTRGGVALDGNGNVVFTLIEQDGRPVSAQLQTGYNFMDEPVKRTTFGKDHLQWPIGKLKENKFTHSFGYYECRCRLQQKEGWWSAFWIQSPIIGASLDSRYTGSEIDIMESFHPGEVKPHNVFTGGYGQNMVREKVGGMPLDKEKFHLFGLLWDENGYTFYIDGKEDGRIEKSISHCPEFILISTEARGYRLEDHQPTAEAYAAIGDTFVVDHVRVFDLKK